MRVSEVAVLLGVSDDTVRRWVDAGRLAATRDQAGRVIAEGADVARLAQEAADPPAPGTTVAASARNRMRGVVTRVVKDGVMAQVEMQAGPFRVVSLMSREAADELHLEPGTVAVASVKATQVVVEVPSARQAQ